MLLTAIRRDWWIYGLASLGHLLFDVPIAPSHVFWPFLGTSLEHVNIVLDAAGSGASYTAGVVEHLEAVFIPYRRVDPRDVALDIGGLALLLAFALRQQLYKPHHLWHFLARGRVTATSED